MNIADLNLLGQILIDATTQPVMVVWNRKNIDNFELNLGRVRRVCFLKHQVEVALIFLDGEC